MRLLPHLVARLNPMRAWEAIELEAAVAEELRRVGVLWVEEGIEWVFYGSATSTLPVSAHDFAYFRLRKVEGEREALINAFGACTAANDCPSALLRKVRLDRHCEFSSKSGRPAVRVRTLAAPSLLPGSLKPSGRPGVGQGAARCNSDEI